MKIAFIISSAINTPLASVFNTETRYEQTVNTIKSIKIKVPNSSIFLHDVTHLDTNYVNNLSKIVDNFFIHNEISSEPKSLGEALLVRKALLYPEIKNYDFIFKISGRYYLNDEFNIKYLINENKNKIMAKRQSHPHMYPHTCYNTVLYCIGNEMIDYTINSLENVYKNLFHDIEHSIFRNIDENNFINLKNLGVEGLFAPTGGFLKV